MYDTLPLTSYFQLGVFSDLNVVSVCLVNSKVFSFHVLLQSPFDPVELLVTTTSFGDGFHWSVMHCVKNHLHFFVLKLAPTSCCSETRLLGRPIWANKMLLKYYIWTRMFRMSREPTTNGRKWLINRVDTGKCKFDAEFLKKFSSYLMMPYD